MRCNELKERDIVVFINQLAKNNLSNKTIQYIVVVMKSIIKYGNMMNEMNLNIALIPCPKNKHVKTDVLSKEEVKELIEYMKNHPSYKNLAIYLSLFTGMGIGGYVL